MILISIFTGWLQGFSWPGFYGSQKVKNGGKIKFIPLREKYTSL